MTAGAGRDDGHGPSVELEAPAADERPIVVHVPHGSTFVPQAVRAGLSLDDGQLAEELRRMTDHRTDELSREVGHLGAWRVVNRRSRLVVDPERFPDEREEMAAVGMGAVYTRTSDGAPLRADDPDEAAVLLDRYYHPYAAAFADLVDALLARHGEVTLVDLHSYPAQTLPYELHGAGPRPQVCIGTDPQHTPRWLVELVEDAATVAGLASARNTPFAGAYVPLGRYGVDGRVRAVMLEIRRDTYLDEATTLPHAGESRVRGFVTDVVARLAARAPDRDEG